MSHFRFTPKRIKIQILKRFGPPIPLLGRPFKKRNIDTTKAANYYLTQELLLKLVQSRKEKEENDELKKLSGVKIDNIKVEVECFEDENFNVQIPWIVALRFSSRI